MKFSRIFAMPNSNTFNISPVRDFILRYRQEPSIDPFARNSKLAQWRNDLNPETTAEFHLDAEDFSKHFPRSVIRFAIFDPPYSPRQISECYSSIGKSACREDTQNARLYKRCRDALDIIMLPGGIVLSFGWNSNGMGESRGYELLEILMVAHGGAHNDTICLAEKNLDPSPLPCKGLL
jgi:hypothetical protein